MGLVLVRVGVQVQEGQHHAVGYHQKDDCQVDYVDLVQPDEDRGFAFQNKKQQEVQGYAGYGKQASLAEIPSAEILLQLGMPEQSALFGDKMKNAPAKEVDSYSQGKCCDYLNRCHNLSFFIKKLFAYPARRACPVFRKFFK